MGNLGEALTHSYGGTGVSSQTKAFAMAVPEGATLLGGIVWESSDNTVPSGITITDTAKNTYAVDGSIASGSTVAVVLFRGRVSNALTTSDSLTVAITGTRIRWTINVDAFDDLLQAYASSPLDRTASNASGSAATMPSGTTDTTTQDKTLSYVAYGAGGGRTFTVPGGWTEKATVQTTVGSADRTLKCIYRYNSLIGVQEVTTGVAPNSTNGGVIGVYKVASGRNNYPRTEHRAEGLPDGTVLTTANSGGAAGTPYELVNGSPEVDTATAARGTRSMLLTASSMSSVGGRDADVNLGVARRVRGRGYFRFPSLPPANLGPIQTISNTVLACRVQFTTSGLLRIVDSAFVEMAGSATPVPLNQWIRMEWRLVASTTAGQASLDVWFDPLSTGTPDISMSSAASFNTLGYFDKYDANIAFSAAQTYSMSVDEIVWTLDDAASPGPLQPDHSYDIDFEAADSLAVFDATGNADLDAAAAHGGTQGLRLDARTLPAFAKLSTLTFGAGHRWASIAAWMRQPLGSLTANCPLVRFRNTDPSSSGTGGNGDIWIDYTTGQIKGDLMPANFLSGSTDMGSSWFYLQAVCGFRDDGTSVLKVKINGAEIGVANSTLPVIGEALAHVVLGSQTAVDAVLDIDDLELTISDTELDYIGSGGPPPGCYVRASGLWVPATPYVLEGGTWVEADANVRSGGSWQAVP